MALIYIQSSYAFTKNLLTGVITPGIDVYYDSTETCSFTETLFLFQFTWPCYLPLGTIHNVQVIDPANISISDALLPCTPTGAASITSRTEEDNVLESILLRPVNLNEDLWAVPVSSVRRRYGLAGRANEDGMWYPFMQYFTTALQTFNNYRWEPPVYFGVRVRFLTNAERNATGNFFGHIAYSDVTACRLNLEYVYTPNVHITTLGITAHTHALGDITITGNYDTNQTVWGPAVAPATNALQQKSGVLKLANTNPVNGLTYFNYVNT